MRTRKTKLTAIKIERKSRAESNAVSAQVKKLRIVTTKSYRSEEKMSSFEKKKELFETKPVMQAIVSLAFPSVIGQIILVIYNIADTFFVGMAKSDAMITAVTVCMPAFMFLSAISNLFGVGGASVISRALGKHKEKEATDASRFAVWGCLFVTLLYSLGAYLMLDIFVDLLGGSDPSVHYHSKMYMIVTVVIGGVPTAMNTLLSHLLRAEGRSSYASFGIAIGGILNVILDPLFMFVVLPAGKEALGAAIATMISNLIALLYYVLIILKNRKRMIFSAVPKRAMFHADIPRNIVLIGFPACLMTLCENISYAVLDNLMVATGTSAQAGIGVAKKVNMLAHSVVRGMTQGVLPLIGYNYASGNRTRMKKVVFLSGSISLGIALSCMGFSLLWNKQLIGLFIQSNSDSLIYGAKFLKILCLGAPFSAFAYTVISFFQAVGRSLYSLVLALLRKGILDIPLMFILNNLYPTFGIVWATPIADFLCCATSVVLFCGYLKRHGKDKMLPLIAESVSPRSANQILDISSTSHT